MSAITQPLTGLSEQEASARRARGQGNNVHIQTGRSYADILRQNVFTLINVIIFVIGAIMIALGRYGDAFVSVGLILLNVVIGYPTAEEERQMLAQTTTAPAAPPQVVATGDDIAAVHALVREIPAASNVVDYASRLVRATRPGSSEAASVVSRYVRWGAGPRAGQSLLLCGKARALLEGRATVALEDVQALALPVLRHRVLVNFQAEAEGLDADAIVARLLSEVPTRT